MTESEFLQILLKFSGILHYRKAEENLTRVFFSKDIIITIAVATIIIGTPGLGNKNLY